MMRSEPSFVRSSVQSFSKNQFHELSYIEWGMDGTRGPVVCVHGLTRQGRDFDFLAQALVRTDHRVICPDVVGRGSSGQLVDGSDYDLQQYLVDMTVLIARLGVEQVDWVGTSLGGMIGILMAGLVNSPIKRLVVNDIGPSLPLDAVLRIGNYVRSAPRSFPNVEAAEKYFREVLQPFGQLNDAQWRHLSEHSIRPDDGGGYRLRYDRRLTHGFKAPWVYRHRLWTAWENIRCPILILRGVQSDLLLPQIASEMLRRNRRAKLIEIEGCGHAPPLMDAHQIEIVTTWLASADAERGATAPRSSSLLAETVGE
jgi:pimeloyl-ACP methyl ester carboxylesterase